MTPPLALRSSVIERDGEQSRLLVLLHGYGEPVADLTRRLPLFDPDAQLVAVAPDAPFERRGRTIWHRALTSPAPRQEGGSVGPVNSADGPSTGQSTCRAWTANAPRMSSPQTRARMISIRVLIRWRIRELAAY